MLASAMLLAIGVGVPLSAALAVATAPPSKYAVRFDGMVTKFREHSSQDIDLVEDARFRELLHSCNAAMDDTKVVTAFRVLYEDLAPVRIGGDLIFGKLDGAVRSVKGSKQPVSRAAPPTTAIATSAPFPATNAAELDAAALKFQVDAREYMAVLAWPEAVAEQFLKRLERNVDRESAALDAGRRVFLAVDFDQSGSVSAAEMQALGGALQSVGQCVDCTCGKLKSCAAVTRLMAEVEAEDEMSFSDFMMGFSRTFGDVEDMHLGGERSEAVVNELLSRGSAKTFKEPSPRASKHRLRFDAMVDEFSKWGSDDAVVRRAEATNPRLSIVLDGCFAGANNPSVVSALRVLYEDYRTLRLGGDLIFKLMKTLVGKPSASA